MLVINYINSHLGDPALPAPPEVPPPYYDVNNDGQVTAADVLQVINYVNRHLAGGEGEAVPAVSGEAVSSASCGPLPSTSRGSRFRLRSLSPIAASRCSLPAVDGAVLEDIETILDNLAPDVATAVN